MKNYIDLTILLDNSGSMDSIQSDMEGALNNMLEGQKQYGDVVVSYYRFNSRGCYE